jgi:Cu/Ag efflux pump CusA
VRKRKPAGILFQDLRPVFQLVACVVESEARRGGVDLMMTALATGLALVPLALGASKPGSELEAPMATVILFGLFSSTALNMIVIPAAYYRFRTHD